MIELRIDPVTGHRKILNGPDGDIHGDQMTDQWVAILMGWGIAIMDELK